MLSNSRSSGRVAIILRQLGANSCHKKVSGLDDFGRRVFRPKSMLSDSAMAKKESTAGIIIIGDEILKGHTQDINSHFLCKGLHDLGVKVKRISVIGDDLGQIAKEITQFSPQFTYVITAGGIGPTHDDITFEGAAKAFGESIRPHQELVDLCRHYFGPDEPLDSPKLKMAFVPESAQLHYGTNPQTGERSKYPVIGIRNVYMFPGIPSLIQRAFNSLQDLFKSPDVKFYYRELFLSTDEFSVSTVLSEFNEKHKHEVHLGSYPDWTNSYYKVKLTVEATEEETVMDLHKELASLLPQEHLVDYVADPLENAVDRVYNLANATNQDPVHTSLQRAIRVVEDALDKYGVRNTCVSFNGGKDCTALLHLYHAVVQRKFPEYDDQLQALYIHNEDSFPEVDQFIKESVQRYNLNLFRVDGNLKESLKTLKDSQPHIKSILMGTRRTDPYSAQLSSFCMTDPSWPQYMRVNPFLDWSYAEVWTFLRSLYLPYCSLYNRGYTSLGSVANTLPNPALVYTNERGETAHKPAYHLQDDSLERKGRSNSKL